MTATDSNIALPMRKHTILGVCEAIGEDFGFNANYLRVPLAALVVISLKWAVVAYLALGAVVLASRMLFPRPTLTETPADARSGPANSNVEERLAA